LQFSPQTQESPRATRVTSGQDYLVRVGKGLGVGYEEGLAWGWSWHSHCGNEKGGGVIAL